MAVEESRRNSPEADVNVVDMADRVSISFEPMSPDAAPSEEGEDKGKRLKDKGEEESGGEPAGGGEEDKGERLKEKGEEKKEEKPGEKPADKTSGEPEPAGTWDQRKSRYKKRINELTRDREIALRKAADLERRVQSLEAGKRGLGSQEPGVKSQEGDDAAKPTVDQFESYEDYIVALGEWSAERKVAERTKEAEKAREKETRSEAETRFQAQIETFKAEHEDFEKVVFDPDLKISQGMVESLMESDRAAEVLYFLGQHPDEAARIAGMTAFAAARELGRIEERLDKGEPAPKKKVVSKAPEPIKPVDASGVVDKAPAEMSNEEYRRWRRKKKGA